MADPRPTHPPSRPYPRLVESDDAGAQRRGRATAPGVLGRRRLRRPNGQGLPHPAEGRERGVSGCGRELLIEFSMEKKYTVFISSTFKDLEDERESLIKATLEIGHIPVGMEMFNAADESQWDVIKRTIQECDYYVVIIGHRYGSLDLSEQISYTEKEYDYAVSKGIPVLAFVINDKARRPSTDSDRESDPIRIQKLNAFKDKASKRMVNFWSDQNDLARAFLASLSKAERTNPRPGWVRMDTSFEALFSELQKIKEENKNNLAIIEKINELNASQNSLDVLIDNLKSLNLEINYKDIQGKYRTTTVDYFIIFEELARSIKRPSTLETIGNVILSLFSNDKENKPEILFDAFENLLDDLEALGLIGYHTQPKYASGVIFGNSEEVLVWTLSDLGKDLLRQIRIKKMEQNIYTQAKSSIDKIG
jgi:hypothetical protein